MKKFNTSPISGVQELLPPLAAQFNYYKTEIANTFYRHGYHQIETPIIERTEVLFAKAGGDTEKQIYKVAKTAETMDFADEALRFDHTVPLARYVVEHMNDLVFPFKVTQIGRNFRGERPQKGRFREFYQCDVDVIGWQNLPIAYDADVILTLMAALTKLPLGRLKLRLSNRKLLSGLLAELAITDAEAPQIFSIIDHAEKVPRAKTVAALNELALSAEQSQRLLDFMDINGSREEVIPRLRALGVQNATFTAGIDELNLVMELLSAATPHGTTKSTAATALGAANQLVATPSVALTADMLIVRGLDYYTGTVFETIAQDYPEIGSVCSGGRYENLASHYTDQILPGVGGSIGLTRLFFILREYNLLPPETTPLLDYAVIPLASEQIPPALELAAQLRQRGLQVDLVLTDKKLGDKLKYASKLARKAILIGEQEIATGNYQVKDFATGEKSVYEAHK